MGAMHLGLEGDASQLDRLITFYVERAKGGAALIVTGGVAVLPAGGGDHMFDLTDKNHCEMLTRIPEAVHRVGGKIALQLFHAGRYAISGDTGVQAVAPSPVKSKFNSEIPREMDLNDIAETVSAFAAGAKFAKDAGYDAIEVMASEGYLLNQFLSPLTNYRMDAYGVSLEGRMRISLEVVQAIRRETGDAYPLIFRMSGDDCMIGSTTVEETFIYAKALEEAGADALNIGIGWHESRVPTVAAVVPRGAFAPVAAAIRRTVNIPVIGANRINTPELADNLMEKESFDFVAPARSWLADPDFANKSRHGDRKGLNVCVACNQSCLDHTLAKPPKPVSCMVNPRTGNEQAWPLTQAKVKRRIAVVGGGPAGMEAARTAAFRGHVVTLFEAGAELGGQLRLAARVPGKEEFYETIRYFRESLDLYGVEVKLLSRPSIEDLLEFDEVVLATGVVPYTPDIPGVNLPHVVTYAQLLSGEVQAGEKIVILGTGGIGCDTAHYLALNAKLDIEVAGFLRDIARSEYEPKSPAITIIGRSGKVAAGIGLTTRWIVRSEQMKHGIRVLTNFQNIKIVPEGVQGDGEEGSQIIEADQIILCTGQSSSRDLVQKLHGLVPLHIVGGARDSKGLNAARAIREAYETAYQIGSN